MGAYHLADEGWHGYPSYTTNVEGERKSYLYRAGGGDDKGKWCVTENKDHIAQNYGPIVSASAAELPTQEGLQWEVRGESDDAIACTEVRPALALRRHRHAHHAPARPSTLSRTPGPSRSPRRPRSCTHSPTHPRSHACALTSSPARTQ